MGVYLDEEIPVHCRKADSAMFGLLLTAFIHLAGSIWWASDISSRLAVVEKWATKTENIPTNVAVVEAQLSRFSEQLNRLNTQLERLGDKLQGTNAILHNAEGKQNQ